MRVKKRRTKLKVKWSTANCWERYWKWIVWNYFGKIKKKSIQPWRVNKKSKVRAADHCSSAEEIRVDPKLLLKPELILTSQVCPRDIIQRKKQGRNPELSLAIRQLPEISFQRARWIVAAYVFKEASTLDLVVQPSQAKLANFLTAVRRIISKS